LFHDFGYEERFTAGLRQEVERRGWIVLAFCWMRNQVHALLQTPKPNFAAGISDIDTKGAGTLH
jgi:REP element-mobilizing transposase RayT